MIRIAHISDIHVRLLKYHDEYERVFEDLYSKLHNLRPDIIVNTGDTGHSKTQMSPELVGVVSRHFRKLSEIASLYIILGNHDLNLMNANRKDAITPIVESMNVKNVHLLKKSGPVVVPHGSPGVTFWVFGIGDAENYPTPESWASEKSRINIGLFHGSINNCVTDSNWRMRQAEHDVAIFSGLDYVLMGDIHKQQFMDPHRRIGYAGSLIQQNFGEDPEKGFLVWDIESKDRHTVYPVHLSGSRKFYTVRLNDDLGFPPQKIEPESHVRVFPPKSLTLVEQKTVEKTARKLFSTKNVLVLPPQNATVVASNVPKGDVTSGNIRKLPEQERLLRDWLSRNSVSDKLAEMVVELNRSYHSSYDSQDEVARDVTWRLNKVAWSNMFNYGEDNCVDFENFAGLVGLFAENSRGKSSFIDIITEVLFDKVTKGITKNLHMINDNKEVATILADVTVDGQDYIIERTIDRIKYGQRKKEEKEWGKTTCNFYKVLPDGKRESLNGDLRPATEKQIRNMIGTFDDFMLTSLTSQVNQLDIINCKETERKKILYKFFDLDLFERNALAAKEDSKEWYDKLALLESQGITDALASVSASLRGLSEEIRNTQSTVDKGKAELEEIGDQILRRSSERVKVDEGVRDEADVIASLVEIDREISALRLTHESLLSERKNLEERSRHLSHQEDDLESLKRESEGHLLAQKSLESSRARLTTLKTRIAGDKKKLRLLQEVPCGDKFPTCKFLVDAFEVSRGLPDIERRLTDVESEISRFESDEQRLLPSSQRYAQVLREEVDTRLLASELSSVSLKLENVELKISQAVRDRESSVLDLERCERFRKDFQENMAIDREISALSSQRSRAQREIESAQERLRDLLFQQGAADSRLEKLKSDMKLLEEARARVTAFEYYIQAMGKDGIAYEILTKKLPLINEEINKILMNSADFTVSIEHDQEEQSIRLYLQYGDYRSRILELAGGAEKMLSSVAIRVALISISNLPKTNLFIIDEGFGKLDPKNLEAVGKMFDYLKTVFEHVITISHIDVMKDMVDDTIEISVDEEGYSHVEA